MKTFQLMPRISQFDRAAEFCEAFSVGAGDLVFVSDGTYARYFAGKIDGATVVNYRKYGNGEPTDLMVEGIAADLQGVEYSRVIAIGGGTILDVAKLFALEQVSPVVELFERSIPAVRSRKLVLVPTTCGTASEVTNISILELTTRATKFGLAVDELYADDAVLIPELLEGLPFRFFATSSIDALIHSIESFTSPKANEFTRLHAKAAMKIILNTYREIAAQGEQARFAHLGEMLIASTYAGISFGNAGCAAVHAMSYPLGAKYHVPHGEANYTLFTGVYKTYEAINPNGILAELTACLAGLLDCAPQAVYDEIETLLNHILPKKPLREHGVTRADLPAFAESVMTRQGRLMANNYVPLTYEHVLGIYETLF